MKVKAKVVCLFILLRLNKAYVCLYKLYPRNLLLHIMLSEEKQQLDFEIPDISKKEKAVYDKFKQYVEVGKILRQEKSAEDLEGAIRKEANDRNGFFLAIAVPMLGGKTQMAFTIRSKLPIYFPLDDTDPIYKMFEVLTKKLMESAKDDRQKMKKYLMDNGLIVREADPRNPKGSSYDYIAIKDFRHLNEMESKTLGLFMSLMQDAETKPKSVDWMIHYTRPRKITIHPISIFNFITHPSHLAFMQKYLIFLDDFYGDFEWLFVRNLCRYLRLGCMMTATGLSDINIMSKEEAEEYTKQYIMG